MKNSAAFYGEDGRPSLYEVISNLRALTGSSECAQELIEACDEIEAACPLAVLTPMPPWIC